jgi:hypothetical protein
VSSVLLQACDGLQICGCSPDGRGGDGMMRRIST